MLVPNVAYNGLMAAKAARDLLHRSKDWVREWLKRHHKEVKGGLKNIPKSGRPADMSKETGHQIKK